MSEDPPKKTGHNAPSLETKDDDGSAGSPFKLCAQDRASSDNTTRSFIPQPRPTGQPSNFGTAELRPKLFESQPEAGDGDSSITDVPSERIMEKVREAGKLATEGRLDSAKAIAIIEQIRKLATQKQARQ